MSGLVKQKEYKVEDSNVDGIGGDEDRAVKKASAKTEPAWKRWESYLDGSILKGDEAIKDTKGKGHHVEIWRIEKFKVKFWPREQHGCFCEGDSYMILHTYMEEDKLKWDLHFWLGKETTQDEMGTAAYKTVELDTLMDDGPVQYREVQEHESETFAKLFSDIVPTGGIRYLPGGVESGFRHVEVAEMKPTLSHIKGTKKRVNVNQVGLAISSLNSGDVFILETKHPDEGKKGWSLCVTWTGTKAGQFEKNKARQVAAAIKTERRGKTECVGVREGDDDDDIASFYKHLGHSGGAPTIASAEAGGSDEGPPKMTPQLFRLSDASGKLTFKKEAEGTAIVMGKFDTNDVMVLDTGEQVFAWIGKKATTQEKQNGIASAVEYLKNESRPLHTAVTRVLEGAESAPFKEAMGIQN